MIWGELINGIRNLHFEFLNQFELPVQVFLKEVELTRENFPYPPSAHEFGDWEPAHFPASINDGLEMHPVERVLLEGPLLPLEQVVLKSETQSSELFIAILNLEVEWIQKVGIFTPEKQNFFEQTIKNLRIRIQAKAGIGRLKSV